MMQRIKTTLWLQALVVSAFIILGIIGYAFARHFVSVSKKVSPEISAERDIQTVVAKGEAYLLGNLASVDARQRLVLDYLQRKFSLDESLNGEKTPINVDVQNQDIKNEMQAMIRIAYPENKVSKIPFKNIVLESVNCDHIPLPGDFTTRMKQDISAGDYELTHAALSLQFITENKCSLDINIDELKAELSKEMVRYAEDPKTIKDLRYESIAFLMLIGQREYVQDNWIQQIVTEQNSDGGWSPSLDHSRSDDHATVLAMWALLEYSRPDTPDQPLIRQVGR